MIYEFKCDECGNGFEVIKPVSECSTPEACPQCGAPKARRIYSHQIGFIGASVKDAYFDISLGKVISSDREKKEILKEKGIIEVGTEKSMDSFRKNTSEKRAKEKEKEWNEL